MIINVILTILVFSLLIIIHELGHFCAAKWSGVKVNEFWLGMGPTIFKKHYKGTDYMLNVFPFGGAVVMEGEDNASTHKNSFQNAKKINKALIMFAGAFMNFVLGFIIVLLLTLPIKTTTSTLFDKFDDSSNQVNSVEVLQNDEFVKINDTKISTASDISLALNISEDYYYDITVKRDGKSIEITNFYLEPNISENDGIPQKSFGIWLQPQDLNLLDKLQLSTKTCISYGNMVWQSLKELVTGNVEVSDLSGPVGISVMIGETAKVSMRNMWNFVAFISINLGIMNLLPLPALDGGRLLILAFESITGKEINKKVEGIIHGVGLLVLFGLMIFITFHDIFVKIL